VDDAGATRIYTRPERNRLRARGCSRHVACLLVVCLPPPPTVPLPPASSRVRARSKESLRETLAGRRRHVSSLTCNESDPHFRDCSRVVPPIHHTQRPSASTSRGAVVAVVVVVVVVVLSGDGGGKLKSSLSCRRKTTQDREKLRG